MITTFYSCQDDRAHTVVLANTARLLSRWGYRTLCIDWDLGESALTDYLMPSMSQPTSGLVELITDLVAGGSPQPNHYVTRIELTDTPTGLSLIAAGNDRLRRADAAEWARLYREHRLGDFFEDCCEAWRREYDVVLVHGQSGTTACRGIYLAQLPDALVLTCAPSDDGVTGMIDVAHGAAAARDLLPYDRGKLLVVPLPTGPGAQPGRLVVQFAPWYRAWVARDVPIEQMVTALVIEQGADRDNGAGLNDPALRLLAALLVRSLADTELIATGTESYIATANRTDTTQSAGIRADIVDVLTDLLLWELETPQWAEVERAMQTMTEALHSGDMNSVADAVTALELASPMQSGEVVEGQMPVPPGVRALAAELFRQLGHHPEEGLA